MRNRAKCKGCGDIIENKNTTGYVICTCGDVSVCIDDGVFRAHLKNKENFLLVDDEGNEIIPKEAILPKDTIAESPDYKPTKKEMLEMLEEMRKRIESLPPDAMLAPITHADFCSLLMLLSSILRAD